MQVQVLVMTSYKEQPSVQVFALDKTEEQIVAIVANDQLFDDDEPPKTLEALGERLGVDFELTSKEVQ